MLTKKQEELKQKHGTPEEFAKACFDAVPGFISVDEANAGIRKYQLEWDAAGADDTEVKGLGKVVFTDIKGKLWVENRWNPSQMDREMRKRVVKSLREIANHMEEDEFEKDVGMWVKFPVEE